jgi:queuine tRNA-ribosyltransferase
VFLGKNGKQTFSVELPNPVILSKMTFTLEKIDPLSKARAGRIETAHGAIETPIFMPVGTLGTVKGVHTRELEEDVKAQIILGNTYHLYLRPGMEVMRSAGGLHRFNGWNKPILTDSGGYQVFSLGHRRKITEEGATFASHIDGSKHLFSPEKSMEIQRDIGGDIIMAFDECPPYPCEYKYAKNSMELTHRWLKRSIAYCDNTPPQYGHAQALFPIVQGSVFKDLRIQSAEFIAEQNAAGNAIGGLSVGEPVEDMYEMTDLVCNILPTDKPRYLMGVGTPVNILENIALGIDMFDCVLPSRNARHGLLYTANGVMNMKNAKWANDHSPIDATEGAAPTSRFYTKAYLRHLFHVEELLAGQIATLHNLAFFLWLVGEARQRIFAGDFMDWKNDMVRRLGQRL